MVLAVVVAVLLGAFDNARFGWEVPTVSDSTAASTILSHAQSLRQAYEAAMEGGDWELTRSIPNVTTGLNVTIDVLKDKSSGPNLIRSSVVIDASPAAVASYYRPSQAEDLKIKTWSSYSALMNLARIESIEILFSRDNIMIAKQTTGPPQGFLGKLLGFTWANKVFTLGQVWLKQEKDVSVKEPDTETIYGRPSRSSFKLRAGSYVFVSATVDYNVAAKTAFKDSVYWFIPEGQKTRLISVSRCDLGKHVPRWLYEYTAGASINSIISGLRSMAEMKK